MNITVDSKLEYQNELEIDNIILSEDKGENLDLIYENEKSIETDITYELLTVNESFCNDSIDEELCPKVLNDKNKNLLFTNILNEQKKEINRKQYLIWLNNNHELLQSAYYILSKKYFNNNYDINFNKFSEFCFLYY